MNKVVLMGRLTRDPELRQTQEGTSVAKFTLAINRKFSKEKQADFIPIIAWGKTAEFCNTYFYKGQRVAVAGRIQVQNYKDDSGATKYFTEVVAEEVSFADGNRAQQGEQQGNAPKQKAQGQENADFTSYEDFDDDLPF